MEDNNLDNLQDLLGDLTSLGVINVDIRFTKTNYWLEETSRVEERISEYRTVDGLRISEVYGSNNCITFSFGPNDEITFDRKEHLIILNSVSGSGTIFIPPDFIKKMEKNIEQFKNTLSAMVLVPRLYWPPTLLITILETLEIDLRGHKYINPREYLKKFDNGKSGDMEFTR